MMDNYYICMFGVVHETKNVAIVEFIITDNIQKITQEYNGDVNKFICAFNTRNKQTAKLSLYLFNKDNDESRVVTCYYLYGLGIDAIKHINNNIYEASNISQYMMDDSDIVDLCDKLHAVL